MGNFFLVWKTDKTIPHSPSRIAPSDTEDSFCFVLIFTSVWPFEGHFLSSEKEEEINI